jgi:hypothetical protein
MVKSKVFDRVDVRKAPSRVYRAHRLEISETCLRDRFQGPCSQQLLITFTIRDDVHTCIEVGGSKLIGILACVVI